MIRLQLKNFLLLFLCIVKYVFYGKANNSVRNPKKVLIIQMAKLGDMVCITPMFRAVKMRYPNCKVYVLGDKINQELLAHSPDVDKYIVFQRGLFLKTAGMIKKEKIDFGCLTGPSPESLALLYLSGISSIAAPFIKGGFCPHETRSYAILRTFVLNTPHTMGQYAAREYLRLLEPIGIHDTDTRKHLACSRGAEIRIKNFFQENKISSEKNLIAGIFPSTGHKVKLWPPRRFARVADYLYKKYDAKIIIVGGKADKKEVDEMIRALAPETKVINTLNFFSVDELKALIARMSLFISVDTGPIYIAEAFGVPTVNIVGPMDEKEQPARGTFNRIVKVERKSPAIHVMNNKVYDAREAARQVNEISVAMVTKEIDDLFHATPRTIGNFQRGERQSADIP